MSERGELLSKYADLVGALDRPGPTWKAPGAAVEKLRSLFSWLAGEEELRGRVRLVEATPERGMLSGWPEAVVVALGQGGAVTVLASAVTAWIRYRTSEVRCTLTRPDGTSVELAANRLRSTDPAGVGELVESRSS